MFKRPRVLAKMMTDHQLGHVACTLSYHPLPQEDNAFRKNNKRTKNKGKEVWLFAFWNSSLDLPLAKICNVKKVYIEAVDDANRVVNFNVIGGDLLGSKL